MKNINAIIYEIKRLYKECHQIHITIQNFRPKRILSDIFVTITGVYQNIFCVEEINAEYPKRYSFQYADVLIGKIKITELS